MKRFYWMLLLLLLLLAADVVAADKPESSLKMPGELPPLDYRGMKLVSSFQSISHALRTLERGFPQIGLAEEAKLPAPNENGEYGAMIADLDKQLNEPKAAFTSNVNAGIAEEAKVFQFRTDLLTGKLAKPPVVKEVPASLNTSKPVEALDLKKFQLCAEKALPALYAKLTYLRSGDGFGAHSADSVLDAERGDGQFIRPEGMACGRYLGASGMASDSTLQEIKTLTALKSVQDRKDLLWQLFVIHSATSRELRLPDPLFWQYAWKEAAFRSAFRKSEKLTLGSLLDGYRLFAQEQPTVLVGTLKGLDERVKVILEKLP